MSNCFNVHRSLLNSTIGKMTKSYWITQELVKTFSWIRGWVGRTVCDCVSGWVCVRSVLGLCGVVAPSPVCRWQCCRCFGFISLSSAVFWFDDVLGIVRVVFRF
jgi:hypothetical protein